MERTAVRGRLSWLVAEVLELIPETPRVQSIRLGVPDWPGHLPGQHIDLRLTAEDGYQAQRSYSIATPTDGENVTITVELVNEGEVSSYLHEELHVGDGIELRGPIGGYFVWEPARGGPLQLVAGGSGLVPLMAMARSLRKSGDAIPARMLVSARTQEDLIYRDELSRLAHELPALDIDYTLTRSHPDGWKGYTRRVDRAMLVDTTFDADQEPAIFVCGPTGFVETVAANLRELGHQPERIRTERFGPTGG
ncbi:MAG TPA: ferredoxin reductase [Acidimicrobiia bacterium]|nr:ferredoxin reductase [Acidimicrobiia bacterium]